MKKLKLLKWVFVLVLLIFSLWFKFIHLDQRSLSSIFSINPNPKYEYGQALDSFNGVKVYYNGRISHVSGRHLAKDGYNLGLKYQCVEFVKRYYYEYYHHKMPDAFGDAKQFIDLSIQSGSLNKRRGLRQYLNGQGARPEIGDLMVFDRHTGNSFGHVAIVSKVTANKIEIIQQNPGAFSSSRAEFGLASTNKGYKVESERLLGWLRMIRK